MLIVLGTLFVIFWNPSNIKFFNLVTRVRKAPAKQSHTPSSKEAHLTRATCGTLPTTTGRTTGRTEDGRTEDDGDDGTQRDGRTEDGRRRRDGRRDGRTEDDDGDDGTDGTDTTGPTDDTYRSKVSNTTLGPRFYHKSKLAVNHLSGHAQTFATS